MYICILPLAKSNEFLSASHNLCRKVSTKLRPNNVLRHLAFFKIYSVKLKDDQSYLISQFSCIALQFSD